MSETIERSTLDPRYEPYRLRDAAREARLLASIAERGIEEPLEGVDATEGRFLLNGFKRYRCATKLGIQSVPYVSLGSEEASGIVTLMRVAPDQSLSILEQAKFVVDLLSTHGMHIAEVAEALSRSKAWVCMRRNLFSEMSDEIQQILFAGSFPVYCYMYTLRPFRRMNAVPNDDVEHFIKQVAGKRLSIREIEQLAEAYFRGPDSMREAINEGRLNWSLDHMKKVPRDPDSCTDFERVLLKDLQQLQKLMQRTTVKCHDGRLTSASFFAQANLLTGSLLTNLDAFKAEMEAFYDRSGQA